MKNFWIIGNWKMYFSFNQAKQWLALYTSVINELVRSTIVNLGLCPSFDALPIAQHYIKDTDIVLGAQNCAAELSGAFTGQISAQSLIELGCQLCLVGHSEARELLGETDNIIAKKLALLNSVGIRPVLCVGEKLAEYEQGKTLDVLNAQLSVLKNITFSQNTEPLIAYEPTWAIGSGKTPTEKELGHVINQINQQLEEIGSFKRPSILYGGSISSKNALSLSEVPGVSGFLIGKASTDFQELKKIVLLKHQGIRL